MMQIIKKIKIGILLLLMASIQLKGASNSATYKVDYIKVQPDVYRKGTYGAVITVTGIFSYKAPRPGNPDPALFVPAISFFTSTGKAVRPAAHTAIFRNALGGVSATTDYFTAKHPQNKPHATEFFIPYYAIDLPAGNYSFLVKVTATLKDTSITQSYSTVPVSGKATLAFKAKFVEKNAFTVKIDRVRVTPLDRKGKAWDPGNQYPDIETIILLNYANTADPIQRFPVIKNSLSASYADGSRVITVSKGDKITFSFKDDDRFFDDTIGDISLTMEELKAAAQSRKVMKFNQVTELVVEDFMLMHK